MLKKFFVGIISFIFVLYIFCPSIMNYMNPLSKPIIAVKATKYIEFDHKMNVKLLGVHKYFPEPFSFEAKFELKDEPKLVFIVYLNPDNFKISGDNYAEVCFDYVINNIVKADIKKAFDDTVTASIEYDYNRWQWNNYKIYEKDVEDMLLSDFSGAASNVNIRVYLKKKDTDLDYDKFYDVIKKYKEVWDSDFDITLVVNEGMKYNEIVLPIKEIYDKDSLKKYFTI